MTANPEIYILRHGQTTWNADGRFQGRLDSPLTARGESQATAMGTLLAQRGVTVRSHALWVSPAGRARATARLAFDGAAARVVDDLCEIGMGDWSGLSREDLGALGVDVDDLSMLDFYGRAPGGEGFDGVWDRAGRVLGAVTVPTILVTHGITSRFLRVRAAGGAIGDVEAAGGGQGVIFRLTHNGIERLVPPGAEVTGEAAGSL